MAVFKNESECIATMYIVNKGQKVPVMELHSKLEWKSLVSPKERDAAPSGERGLLEIRSDEKQQNNVKKLLRNQKFQLLWLAVKNLFM